VFATDDLGVAFYSEHQPRNIWQVKTICLYDNDEWRVLWKRPSLVVDQKCLRRTIAGEAAETGFSDAHAVA
jgi:hypothetical protein